MRVRSEVSDADRLLTPDEIGSLVPSRRKGRNTSPQTVRKWMMQGLRGKFLKYVRVGTIPCATESDLLSFFTELTRDDEKQRFVHVDETVASPTRSEKAISERQAVSKQRAERLGL